MVSLAAAGFPLANSKVQWRGEIDTPQLVARLRRLGGRRELAGRLAKSSAAPDGLQRRDGASSNYAGFGRAAGYPTSLVSVWSAVSGPFGDCWDATAGQRFPSLRVERS